MGVQSSITRLPKKGCIILACDPAKQIIQARIAPAQDVPVHAFTQTPAFRWPKVGEEWWIKEENGGWFLDSIIEPQGPTKHGAETIEVEPGDQVLSISSGRLLGNESGVLSVIYPSSGSKGREPTSLIVFGPWAPTVYETGGTIAFRPMFILGETPKQHKEFEEGIIQNQIGATFGEHTVTLHGEGVYLVFLNFYFSPKATEPCTYKLELQAVNTAPHEVAMFNTWFFPSQFRFTGQTFTQILPLIGNKEASLEFFFEIEIDKGKLEPATEITGAELHIVKLQTIE